MRSLFIHDPADLDAPIPGGVQLCSREFLEVVRAASDDVALVPVTVTRSPHWRARRKLGLGAYLLYHPGEARTAIADAVKKLRPTHAFLNRSELMRLSGPLRELAPGIRVVLMSHGNQSGDDLYEIAGPGGRRAQGWRALRGSLQLGLDLVAESRHRHRHLHGVCVMSREEEMLERWLGASRVAVLPRLVRPRPVDWKPVAGRAGFVGTLDHTPNRVALQNLCARLAASGRAPELRIVGGPESHGRALAAAHPFVHYLGRLDDDALREEVATWSLFLNPVFWLSRGASMKLGQSLAWGLPTLTSGAGARGYEFETGIAAVCDDDADSFAQALLGLLANPAGLENLRNRTLSAHWIDAATLGQRVKACFA